jgi:hypothetical protein
MRSLFLHSAGNVAANAPPDRETHFALPAGAQHGGEHEDGRGHARASG